MWFMFIKFDESRYGEAIGDIKAICESENYTLPKIFSRDLTNEYLFSDSEGEEFKNF